MAQHGSRSSQALVVTVHIDGVRGTLAQFRGLPKDASNTLRDRSLELSKSLAEKVKAAAISEGGQAALMAPTVKANRDRVPAVTAGGLKKVGPHRVPAYKLLFASEFGMTRRTGWYRVFRYRSSTGRQYKPHLGANSYWFFRTVEHNESEIGDAWNEAADDIVREFSTSGE
jgi:hypothetical protein